MMNNDKFTNKTKLTFVIKLACSVCKLSLDRMTVSDGKSYDLSYMKSASINSEICKCTRVRLGFLHILLYV